MTIADRLLELCRRHEQWDCSIRWTEEVFEDRWNRGQSGSWIVTILDRQYDTTLVQYLTELDMECRNRDVIGLMFEQMERDLLTRTSKARNDQASSRIFPGTVKS